MLQSPKIMKSSILISAVVLVGLGIGLFQHSQLADLREESARLAANDSKQLAGNREASSGSTSTPAVKSLTAESQAEIETMMTRVFEAMASSRGGGPSDQAEQAEAMKARKLLFTTFAGLDHRAVFDLIGNMKTNGNLPAVLRDNPAEACVEILVAANPKEAIGLLQMLTDFPNRDNVINQAFHQWAAANPKEALQWFNEESKKGNPIAANPGMLKTSLLIQVRVDPARALSHEQFQELTANPGESANFGATIAATLQDVREHSEFLAAMRREQEKSPDSATLAKIRAEYIGELSSRMDLWAFDDASTLIDSEFTQSEKLAAMTGISQRADMAEPTRWADWFAKIVVPEGTRHPLTQFVEGWMHADDYISAGKWLEQATPGELKDHLVFEYAFLLAENDPATAIQWAVKLPEGKLRTRAFKEVGKKWKAKDPAAASAFANEQGLPE